MMGINHKRLYVLVVLDILIKGCLAMGHMEASFVYKVAKCTANLTVYRTVSSQSIVSCAVACLQDNCDKYLWDVVHKICMLHSEDTSSMVIPVNDDMRIYRRRHACSVVGYDLISPLNMCYKMFKDISATWVESQTICQENGGNLTSITNNAVKTLITDILLCGRRSWIGLRNRTWLNGQPFVNIFGPSTDLNDRDVTVFNDTDSSCGTIVPTIEEVYVKDYSCNTRERDSFICEIHEGP